MNDIQSALSESLKVSDIDMELEEELQELLNSSEKAANISLPSVPTTELPDLERELKNLDFEGF